MISHTLHPPLGFDAPVAGAPRHLRAPDAGGAQGGAAQPGWGAPQLGASLGRFLPCSKFNFQWFHGTPLGWQKVKVLSKMQQSAIESQHWQIEGGELHEFRLLFGLLVFSGKQGMVLACGFPKGFSLPGNRLLRVEPDRCPTREKFSGLETRGRPPN